MIKAGQREVGRTRAVKFARQLIWERPEERFRLPMEEVKDTKPGQMYTNTTNAAVATTRPNGETDQFHCKREASSLTVQSNLLGTSDGGDLDKVGGSAPAVKGGESVAMLNAAAMPQQEGASLFLTIEVWSKRVIGGRQDFLGTAIVPSQDIEHPPGDAWLPLGSEGVSPSNFGSLVSANNAMADVKNAHVKISEPPPAGTVGIEGGGKSWGSGVLRVLRGPRKTSSKNDSGAGLTQSPTGSVHVWLGKVRRSSSSGLQPGRGRVILRVHAASGLRKVQT